jgi:hypothetical protein
MAGLEPFGNWRKKFAEQLKNKLSSASLGSNRKALNTRLSPAGDRVKSDE